jgi:ATP-dependent Clp protease ATP-binding subunit ClpA
MVAFTEQAGLLSALAQQEARRLRHHYLGAEHLLLGLLRDAQDPIEAHLYLRSAANAPCWACPTAASTRSGC